MELFNLKIVAANKVFFDGKCQNLIVPYVDSGSIAFLAKHENTVLPIDVGEMKITDESGRQINAFVGNGILEFLDNEAVIVCVSAELPDEIDERRANEAKERAEEELRQHTSSIEYNISKANLARAMERLKVKNRHKI
ncbi:MAG: F0F1 ATP synthase subunit epsilon [Clostridiales bacterium]|nr:F0F1 ATP synthase subunit epsilon [Clostridiales bacterium]